MLILKAEGLIDGRQGKGVYVATPLPRQPRSFSGERLRRTTPTVDPEMQRHTVEHARRVRAFGHSSPHESIWNVPLQCIQGPHRKDARLTPQPPAILVHHRPPPRQALGVDRHIASARGSNQHELDWRAATSTPLTGSQYRKRAVDPPGIPANIRGDFRNIYPRGHQRCHKRRSEPLRHTARQQFDRTQGVLLPFRSPDYSVVCVLLRTDIGRRCPVGQDGPRGRKGGHPHNEPAQRGLLLRFRMATMAIRRTDRV